MLVTVLIFVVLFFLYVHINSHYKKNEDLEIYETDYTTNPDLQEVCDLKQPTLFDFRASCPELFENDHYGLDKIIQKYDKYLVKVKDCNDYFTNPPTEVIDAVPLSLGNYHVLAMTDSKTRYYTDNNEFFMEDSGMQVGKMVDDYLKPNFAVQKSYDMISGSRGTSMPMQYHNHYRRYLIVTSGRIHVKMTPWKSHKYLHPVTDYENYEFRSAMNVWTANHVDNKIRADYERIKFTEFDVHTGYVLYIPPYWWYSIQFAENTDTVVLGATYDSAVSIIANGPDLLRHFLQLQRNKEIITRTLSIESKAVDPPAITHPVDEEPQEPPTTIMDPLTEQLLPSGEPYTASALELTEQLQSQHVVPIREQHEQLMQHILG
jgi:hypothetical protein